MFVSIKASLAVNPEKERCNKQQEKINRKQKPYGTQLQQ